MRSLSHLSSWQIPASRIYPGRKCLIYHTAVRVKQLSHVHGYTQLSARLFTDGDAVGSSVALSALACDFVVRHGLRVLKPFTCARPQSASSGTATGTGMMSKRPCVQDKTVVIFSDLGPDLVPMYMAIYKDWLRARLRLREYFRVVMREFHHVLAVQRIAAYVIP